MTIPALLHQTIASTPDLNAELAANVARLKDLQRGWTHTLYDDRDIESFINAEYGERMLRHYARINPRYGAARADFFRYLLLYRRGGVYLDIKSTVDQPLTQTIADNDVYVLSHWDNAPGRPYENWGIYPGCEGRGEFQQWHIIAAPGHPFLQAAISAVIRNIALYDFARDGAGKRAVVGVTGPLAYTRAIMPILALAPHRIVNIETLGFRYSIAPGTPDEMNHRALFADHYATLEEPLILP